MNAVLKSALEGAVREATGRPSSIRALSAAPGGCIHHSYVLEGAARYFAKTNEAAFQEAFAAEAEGLAALAAAGMRVPQPLAHGACEQGAYLVLEYVELRRGTGADACARLGRALAELHAHCGDGYGWPHDNYIGPTAQKNAWHAGWAEFWREERLRPQLELAARDGHASLARLGERLCARLDALLAGHAPAPSLLHGDLWRGNAGFLGDGTPVVFDPAVYWGDRETDLAMTELFGGFAPSFYAAYREAAPLEAGYEVRKTLYNLYHVLNHAHLFGGGYPAQAERMVHALLAESGV
jgi:fructosamine-3-kinase